VLDKVRIYESEEILRQMWINLLDNAIKFTGQNGTIHIALHDQGEWVEFEISDNGCGMSEETKSHLFDRFYQGDKSHAQEGSGLGLTLVKRIVELCGGSITVKSELGVGSVFTVRLQKNNFK
jgi:signal transduction histidine kinase